ncbi:MAG TPA: Gfo/Idh/MocA family oxidoreductase [Sedimentisphaerales bacterium]|nr:Gfo/Idh/MocA family oxidoreductase [Sedimentisphaerales bacterium]
MTEANDVRTGRITRRGFLGAGATLSFTIVGARTVAGTQANSRIKVGVIGLGGRGRMIADMARRHGGYEIVALADYFEQVVHAAGDQLGISKANRFAGLSGYKGAIAADVEAVFLETPPYCFPEHVEAAAEANRHIYIAKPLGCDVPGCLRVRDAARRTTVNKRVFLCDFQTRTDPFITEGIRRVRDGEIGSVGMLSSEYNDESFRDPPKTATVEDRLQELIWVNDDSLGGSYLVNAGIHAIDVALWIAGQMPTSATGASRIVRTDPHGDSHDVFSLTYEFANGLILNHRGEHLKNRSDFRSDCIAQGSDGWLETGYTTRARILAQSGGWRGGDVVNLYAAGAERNIDTFHKSVAGGVCDNPTVEPSIDATLATILGREAARRRTKLTLDEILRENRRLEPDLTGLRT